MVNASTHHPSVTLPALNALVPTPGNAPSALIMKNLSRDTACPLTVLAGIIRRTKSTADATVIVTATAPEDALPTNTARNAMLLLLSSLPYTHLPNVLHATPAAPPATAPAPVNVLPVLQATSWSTANVRSVTSLAQHATV